MHLQLVARFSGIREPPGDLCRLAVSETLPGTRLQKASTTSAGIVGTIHAHLKSIKILIYNNKIGGATHMTRTIDPATKVYIFSRYLRRLRWRHSCRDHNAGRLLQIKSRRSPSKAISFVSKLHRNWWLGFRGVENHKEICADWPCQRRFQAPGSRSRARQAPELSGQFRHTRNLLKY